MWLISLLLQDVSDWVGKRSVILGEYSCATYNEEENKCDLIMAAHAYCDTKVLF